MSDHKPNPGIDGIRSRGDLERFILEVVRRAGSISARHVMGLGPQLRMTRGTTTLNGGGASSASTTVTHGLKNAKGEAVTPAQVLITTRGVAQIIASVSARDSSTFTLYNRHYQDLTYSTDIDNDWIAVA